MKKSNLKDFRAFPLIDLSLVRDPQFQPPEDMNRFLSDGSTILIDKPARLTSFSVVRRVRAATGIKKIGHCGTLDPLATGLLILCTGRATKAISSITDSDKTYEGAIQLGTRTDTDDIEGQILEKQPVPIMGRAELDLIVQQNFSGQISQVPPQYSAVKVGGVRSYKMARRGVSVPLEPRLQTIHNIDVLEFSNEIVKVRVRCSKGTYIRAIARDLGNLIGCGACLCELRRTEIGEFSVSNSFTIDNFSNWIAAHEA